MLRFVHLLAATGAVLALSSCMLMPSMNQVRTIVYDCQGARMMVAYNPNDKTASVSWPGEPLRVLREYDGGRTFTYSDGRYRLRGQDYQVQWEIRGQTPVTCRARAA